MLDIKVIRDNPDEVISRLATRNKDYSAEINKIITLDKDRRNLISATEAVKAHKNEISKKIPEMKKQNLDVTAIFEETKKLSDEMKEDEDKLAAIDKELEFLLLSVPNLPSKTTPIGKDDSENVEIRRYGEPRKFDFEPKPHWELGQRLGILDPETAAKVTGARFHFY